MTSSVELHGIDPAEVTDSGIAVRTPTQVREKWARGHRPRHRGVRRRRPPHRAVGRLAARRQLLADRGASSHTGRSIRPTPSSSMTTITAVLDWTTAAVGDPAQDFMFYRVAASPNAFEQMLTQYGAGGGRIWPRLADHCAEMFSANAVGYGLYALETEDPAHHEAAAAQLNPESSETRRPAPRPTQHSSHHGAVPHIPHRVSAIPPHDRRYGTGSTHSTTQWPPHPRPRSPPHSLPAHRTVTVPWLPFRRTRCPFSSLFIASRTLMTAGMPSSRAVTAPCDSAPPLSVMTPAAW